MKKSVLALAVAAALVGFGSTAYADTTLYGSARVSLDYVDQDAFDSDSDGVWDVHNNSSRLGVRGSEDLGGGLSAIYQYEFGVDLTEGSAGFNANRPKWVGLKGDSWGSITAGTQWSAYYNVTGFADIFNSARTFDTGTGYLGARYGARLDNSILYTTPNLSGFTAQAMLILNGTGTADNRFANVSDDIDLWQLGANYKNGPFYAGLTYMQLQDDNNVFGGDDLSQWALIGGYSSGPFTAGLLYEQGDLNYISTSSLVTGFTPTTDDDEVSNIMLFGSYTFGNSIVRLGYSYMELDGDYRVNATGRVQSYGEIQNLLIGYQYNLSKRTRLWAEYLGRSDDNNGILTRISGDQDVFSLGMRHDF
jgi:predicted porin